MTVTVYCASSTQIAASYFEAAATLGRLLGEQQIQVVNGAGNIGLMKAVSDAALQAGGQVTGVMPDMHTRKQTMASLSDAAIALPGGYGTFEELLEIITWRQLGLYSKPVVILNLQHYYDPLLAMFQKAQEEHFMRPVATPLWEVAETPEEAVQLITNNRCRPSVPECDRV